MEEGSHHHFSISGRKKERRKAQKHSAIPPAPRDLNGAKPLLKAISCGWKKKTSPKKEKSALHHTAGTVASSLTKKKKKSISFWPERGEERKKKLREL